MPQIAPQFNALSHIHNNLEDWLTTQLDEPLLAISALAGDASSRRYFRVQTITHKCFILSIDTCHTTQHQFVRVADLLKHYGLPVPTLYAVEAQSGWVVQSDLGNIDLLSATTETNRLSLYQKGINILHRLQALPINENFPAFDAFQLRKEHDRTCEWFIDTLLALPLDETERASLERFYAEVTHCFSAYPPCMTHRDFHAQNLLWCNGELHVIDFQDLCLAPPFYDLAAFLQDCRAPLSSELHHILLAYYHKHAHSSEWPKDWVHDYFTIAGQIHFKILGIFAKLSLDAQKSKYLQYIPTLLEFLIKNPSPVILKLQPLIQKFVENFKA